MSVYVSAHEANQGFPELLSRAANGERIVITRRGEPVAELVPFGSVPHRADTSVARSRLLQALNQGLHLGGEPFDRYSLYDR
jgi:prevent-host-death family protein